MVELKSISVIFFKNLLSYLKETKIIFNIMILVFVILSPDNTYAQKYYTGYQYTVNSDEVIKFKYTREYIEEEDLYTTIYKIYDLDKGKHAITVTAVHYKPEKRVVVEVEDASGGFFSDMNKEETTYEEPSSEPFGFRGSIGALIGKKVPNQLKVKFVSEKYENIKVMDIMSLREYGTYQFLVLDD